MNRFFLILSGLIISTLASAQSYDPQKLEVLAKIWGECYLFHPSVIRADKNIVWEKELVDFLPKTKEAITRDELIKKINQELLAKLDDPFTCVQKKSKEPNKSINEISGNKDFILIRLDEIALSDYTSILKIDSIIRTKEPDKPIVLDCRINNIPETDIHTYDPFQYILSMFINEPIACSQLVSREHFGWDENNDWWFYEQRWRLSQKDKQQKRNGELKTLRGYQEELSQLLPGFNPDKHSCINNPLYFITNNSFLSSYESSLLAFQNFRQETYILHENTGKIIPNDSHFKIISFPDFDFILNPYFPICNGNTSLKFAYQASIIKLENIRQVIHSPIDYTTKGKAFSFKIHPRPYQSCNSELTTEEKIMGIIKLWTIVNYFYPYIDSMSINWSESLPLFLAEAQKCPSDKDYYQFIQRVMANLGDSHVSTFHPSILDFSAFYIAPIDFDWIENKAIITKIDSSLSQELKIGDEIIAINHRNIPKLIEEEKQSISYSNTQGLITNIINPGYFTGPAESTIDFEIKQGNKTKNISIKKTVMIFQFMASRDERIESCILESNIAYLNMSQYKESKNLERELQNMKNTRGLIIDLRNAYPTHDFNHFLEMLCSETCIARRSEVPIVNAFEGQTRYTQWYRIQPDQTFNFKKPIAVLIDKSMISRPEDIAIALKAFPNVCFIGEQTQGTDGEVCKVYLPGGGETSFTGQVIRFGDNTPFQRQGIRPDIKVVRTIAGVKNGKDETLEAAIKYFKTMGMP